MRKLVNKCASGLQTAGAKILFGILIILPWHCSYSETINLIKISDGIAVYVDGLIKLALSYSDKPYVYNYAEITIYTSRQITLLKEGEISIFWSGTTPEYESSLRPVRVPLYRGLLGYRVLMIRKNEQHRFDHIHQFEDLHSISIGQGRFWSDTQILEANGLHITKALKYGSLFHMLDGGRFDAFPRGIQEPWQEIQKRPDLALDVEKNVLLIYRMPYYLFVNKNNVELANDLESGLVSAINDGSFNAYFFSNPTVTDVIEKSNLKNRRFFYLVNPFLSPETPLDREEFWLDPKSL